MKIAVCVKHAVDETELRIDSSGKPQLSGAAAKMSTFDKNAVEESLLQRSKDPGEVVIYTVGPPEAKKTLKEALAMGADRGVLVVADLAAMDSLSTARALGAAIKRGGPYDLVICSEGSSDTYTGQVPPMLSEVIGLPFLGYVRKLEVSGGRAKAERALEDSLEVAEAQLPLVVSVVSEINEPRYPTLIQIMQAGKKPVEEFGEGQLDVAREPGAPTVLSMTVQSTSRKHVMIDGTPDEAASKLVDALAKEGVLTN